MAWPGGNDGGGVQSGSGYTLEKTFKMWQITSYKASSQGGSSVLELRKVINADSIKQAVESGRGTCLGKTKCWLGPLS